MFTRPGNLWLENPPCWDSGFGHAQSELGNGPVGPVEIVDLPILKNGDVICMAIEIVDLP